jgi:hypothetical protein
LELQKTHQSQAIVVLQLDRQLAISLQPVLGYQKLVSHLHGLKDVLTKTYFSSGRLQGSD